MQIKAIKLQPDDPFTWASGWKSPIYCDNRLTLSFPPVRNFIREELSKGMVEKFGKPDVVVGVATGAIAHGVLVAEYLGLPFAYVRSAPKSHGRQNQIEGAIEPGQFAVVVEDLVSTGMSSLAAVDALRAAEVNVSGMMAIFSYDFAVAKENFQQAECDLYTLSDYPALLKLAQRNGFISSSEKKLLEAWRLAPSEWSI
jgi:orotate phosphoribosyltransferase